MAQRVTLELSLPHIVRKTSICSPYGNRLLENLHHSGLSNDNCPFPLAFHRPLWIASLLVAKQRPSKAEELEIKNKVRADSPKNTRRYWSQRLHQAAYTRSGVAHKVRHWSIKIQHRGIRRSISLATISRSLAAQRAHQIYESIQSLGWQAAEDQIHQILGETAPHPEKTAPPTAGTRTSSFWKQRLSQRSYLTEAGLQG